MVTAGGWLRTRRLGLGLITMSVFALCACTPPHEQPAPHSPLSPQGTVGISDGHGGNQVVDCIPRDSTIKVGASDMCPD